MSSLSPFQVGDLAGLSDPAKELIHSISQAIGGLYEPRRIIQKAKAEAEAKIIATKAEGEVELIKYQSQLRIDHLEERRQRNINKIVGTAIDQLPDKISDEKPDEDWLIQFFNQCQDIGNEQMQDLWAKILAGEFTKPNSFSLRTLYTVKLLTQEDAEKFNAICSYAWELGVIGYPALADFFHSRKIHLATFIHLDNLGLISSQDIFIHIKQNEGKILRYMDTIYIIQNISSRERAIHFYPLSAVGFELLSLCNCDPDPEYINKLASILSEQKLSLTKMSTEQQTNVDKLQ